MKKTRSPKPAKRQSSATRLSAKQLSSIHKMRTLLLEMGDKIDAFHWTREQAIEIVGKYAEYRANRIEWCKEYLEKK